MLSVRTHTDRSLALLAVFKIKKHSTPQPYASRGLGSTAGKEDVLLRESKHILLRERQHTLFRENILHLSLTLLAVFKKKKHSTPQPYASRGLCRIEAGPAALTSRSPVRKKNPDKKIFNISALLSFLWQVTKASSFREVTLRPKKKTLLCRVSIASTFRKVTLRQNDLSKPLEQAGYSGPGGRRLNAGCKPTVDIRSPMNVCVCVCVCVFVRVCIHIFCYTHKFCSPTRTHAHTHTRTHAHTHARARAHTHTHTQTCKQPAAKTKTQPISAYRRRSNKGFRV